MQDLNEPLNPEQLANYRTNLEMNELILRVQNLELDLELKRLSIIKSRSELQLTVAKDLELLRTSPYLDLTDEEQSTIDKTITNIQTHYLKFHTNEKPMEQNP